MDTLPQFSLDFDGFILFLKNNLEILFDEKLWLIFIIMPTEGGIMESASVTNFSI